MGKSRQQSFAFEVSSTGKKTRAAARGTRSTAGKRSGKGGDSGKAPAASKRVSAPAKPARAAPARRKGRKPAAGEGDGAVGSAESVAKQQRDISVSEFFAKNRHLLGFDNPAKALLTTVKELVDNALDAADEARIPADIEVRIDQLAEDRFCVRCTDNGPGIVAKNVPSVFGKLLFGSKFHRLKMSRGQQGIGVSAAGMYGLLTTGHPVRVISRTGSRSRAMRFEIAIDTRKNQPGVRLEEETDWDQPHGTQVEIELEASYRKGQHSVDSYIHQISLANPHARLEYLPPDRLSDADIRLYDRVTKELPPETAEIKPHPYGVELGVLMQWLRETKQKNLQGFLSAEFSRMSARLSGEICDAAGIARRKRPDSVGRAEAEKLHRTIAATKIMAPPTDCIAPIGEKLLQRAMNSIHPSPFITSVTRRPTVYRGNPFLVEVALAYGGEGLSAEDPALMYRYANRVPLQYQQGACAVTRAITSTDWKKYALQQPRGGAPIGPMVIMVHIASVWVPFTSESKEAIAHYPEIIKEIRLGLQDCGRRLATHLRKRRREADELKKRSYIQKYIPHVAAALQEILSFSDAERDKTVEVLTDVLERSRKL